MKTNKSEAKKPNTPEIVGRKYQQVRYAVHSRLVNGGDGWYGSSHYRTEADARAAINSIGKRYERVGGITLDMGEPENLYEYRIVKLVCDCEIIHTEMKLV